MLEQAAKEHQDYCLYTAGCLCASMVVCVLAESPRIGFLEQNSWQGEASCKLPISCLNKSIILWQNN